MPLSDDAIDVLSRTSRTFYIPIVRLPEGLRDAVGSAYLCMRAIDEIEDHPLMSREDKTSLLRAIGEILDAAAHDTGVELDRVEKTFAPFVSDLPVVTVCLGEYAMMAPPPIAPRVWGSTATMARRMSQWADSNWRIRNERDLDEYTLDVAGRVGLLLNELWKWFDGTAAPDAYAVGFGRGLQSVNILRNRTEDMARGVDFYPDGWTNDRMHAYVRKQLDIADAYMSTLPKGPVYEFCQIPLVLARATEEAIRAGQPKLTRATVEALVAECINGG